MISIFLTLLLGHLLADFPLQTNWMVRMKRKSHWGVSIHVIVYVGVTALLLENASQEILLLIALGATHWLIDTIKISSESANSVRGFVLDQAAHIASLLLATAIVTHADGALPIGLLTEQMLYTANIFALIISMMVMLWVWACSVDAATVLPIWLLRWTQRQMLQLSQRIGLVLVSGIAIKLLF